MTLLNAPEFDVQKETRKRNILVGSGSVFVLIVLLTVAGFLLGHGWLFINLPVEHKVKTFLTALKGQDYPKAYGIFYNDADWQQHPDKYKDYPLQRFTEDFTTESEWKGPITSFKVGCSKRDTTGTAVASTINGSTNLTLKYQRSDGTLSFFPFELSCGF
ncbi:MAG: hypothetical protein M3O31_16595 [Acidobacteriota bacterium]|nr:hypothetical protein [Acidobacteriota bacterium]